MKPLPKYHAAIGFREFERSIKAAKLQILDRAPAFLGYRKKAVARRLTQRFVELTLNSFVTQFASQYLKNDSNQVDSTWFVAGGLRVNCITGKISLSLKLAFLARADFFAHWLYVFWIHLSACLKRPQRQGKGALLFGVGKEHFSDQAGAARFANYCSLGGVKPLSSVSRLIVQAVGQVAGVPLSGRLIYARFPLFALVQSGGSDFGVLIRFLCAHFTVLVSYIYKSTRFPLVAILGRDFAYHGMVSQLNQRGLLEAVVLTNSNYTAQPLWMTDLPKRKYSTHMVWYSMNIIPLLYKADRVESPVPGYRHVQADEHWVWSTYYSDYLKGLGMAGHMNVVSPIIWNLPESSKKELDSSQIKIILFDVTPISKETELKLGLVNVYYNFDVMSSFLHGILDAVKELEEALNCPVRVLLKTKRDYNEGHDERYINLLSRLNDERVIELVPHQENVYRLLSECDLSITIPNSSPPLIAAYLNKKAIYYDPTGKLLPNHEPGSNIIFVSGFKKLSAQICSCIRA